MTGWQARADCGDRTDRRAARWCTAAALAKGIREFRPVVRACWASHPGRAESCPSWSWQKSRWQAGSAARANRRPAARRRPDVRLRSSGGRAFSRRSECGVKRNDRLLFWELETVNGQTDHTLTSGTCVLPGVHPPGPPPPLLRPLPSFTPQRRRVSSQSHGQVAARRMRARHDATPPPTANRR